MTPRIGILRKQTADDPLIFCQSLCKQTEPPLQVDQYYNPPSANLGAARFLNPSPSQNFTLNNLHPNCEYRYFIVGLHNNNVVARKRGVIRTNRRDWFDGFACLWSDTTERRSIENDYGAVAMAMIATDFENVSDAYLVALDDFYLRNTEQLQRHKSLMTALQIGDQDEDEPDSISRDFNPIWLALNGQHELLARWQSDLKKFDFDIATFVRKHQSLEGAEILARLADDEKSWAKIFALDNPIVIKDADKSGKRKIE